MKLENSYFQNVVKRHEEESANSEVRSDIAIEEASEERISETQLEADISDSRRGEASD